MTQNDQNDEIILESELILNEDNSVYHLRLKAEHIADTVILVGDPGRVSQVSGHFDQIYNKIQNREFLTHTGVYKGLPVSVISSGIGTDNIDIVINELDAAINIDPVTRKPNTTKRSLNIIRIGTSGGLQKEISVGSFVLAEYGLGFDGLMHYYQYPYSEEELELTNRITRHLNIYEKLPAPYVTGVSKDLMQCLEPGMIKGITATASGFYGPQGRRLNLEPRDPTINERMRNFNFNNQKITNFEMETSALYGLGKMLGHRCCTCCAIIANRLRKDYSNDHAGMVDHLISDVLHKLSQL